MVGKSKRVGARDGQWNRARRAAALALSVSLLACDPSMMRGARAKVARVPGAELERAAREEAETDSLHLERFWTTPRVKQLTSVATYDAGAANLSA